MKKGNTNAISKKFERNLKLFYTFLILKTSDKRVSNTKEVFGKYPISKTLLASRVIFFCYLLAPQSGALRISAYRDFHPIPSHPIHPLIAFEHLSLSIVI